MKHDESHFGVMAGVETEALGASSLSTATRDRLIAFVALLSRWNATIKLVSSQDMPHVWTRHIDDALQLVPHMPPQATQAVDLGSGGGFPGLVLAMVTGVHFDLIEADGRKAAFLREAVAITKVPATIHTNRIEDVNLEPRMLVTARALAPLSKLLELSRPFVATSGVCLFPKGEHADAEILEARKHWTMDLQRISSRTSSSGQILRVTGLKRREAAIR